MRLRPPTPTDGDGVAVNRERFLTAEALEPAEVRDTILASWSRSRELKVAADRIELPYIRDPEVDTPLTRSAEPVLRTLREQLEGQQVSIVLTDPGGLVLVRLTAGDELERYLDRVMLAPGFSYAEEFVGTNGIGTALEGGRPMHVFGHEHYAEHLETLACAGVPIHHPISGKTVGAVDLTCWRRDAGSLLLTLAKSTAAQIRQQLLADAGTRELELFHEYLRVCRRTAGIVFAVDSDVSMMNDLARTVLDPADQAALLGHGADALAGGRSGRLQVQLPTGATARMMLRPVIGSSGGGVVQVKILPPAASSPATTPAAPPRAQLPGLVGSSPLWLRACDEVERAYRLGEWIAVEGEPGVGKAAVLRAVQLRRQPVGRFAAHGRGRGGQPGLAGRPAPDRAGRGRQRGAAARRHARRSPAAGGRGDPAGGVPAAGPALGGRHRRHHLGAGAARQGDGQAAAAVPGHGGRSRRCVTTSRTCSGWSRSCSPGSATAAR